MQLGTDGWKALFIFISRRPMHGAYIKPELLRNDTELKMQLDIRCKKISFRLVDVDVNFMT
jgi:hypothetical protein